MRIKGLAFALGSLLSVSAVVCPVLAGQGDMIFRFGLVLATPTDDFQDAGQTTELDDAVGFQAGFEYGVTDRLGIEPALSVLNHDVDFTPSGQPTEAFGDIDWLALTANANFHFLEEKKADVYVGPTVGYVFWGDIERTIGTKVPVDDEFIYGANVGVDVPFGDRSWGFSGAINYLFSEVSVDGGGEIGVDPIQIKIGLLYKKR